MIPQKSSEILTLEPEYEVHTAREYSKMKERSSPWWKFAFRESRAGCMGKKIYTVSSFAKNMVRIWIEKKKKLPTSVLCFFFLYDLGLYPNARDTSRGVNRGCTNRYNSGPY